MKYELTFYEALDILVNNKGWVQGENFADGVVLMIDEEGYTGYSKDYVHVHDFSSNRGAVKSELQITYGVVSQKYRVVCTQPDAERKLK